MRDHRLCPFCLAGRMIVLWSRAVGEKSQHQRRECKSCGRRKTCVVPRDSVWSRGTRPIVVQKKTQMAERLARIQSKDEICPDN
jgi:transcriptional regulator NrdR family protein